MSASTWIGSTLTTMIGQSQALQTSVADAISAAGTGYQAVRDAAFGVYSTAQQDLDQAGAVLQQKTNTQAAAQTAFNEADTNTESARLAKVATNAILADLQTQLGGVNNNLDDIFVTVAFGVLGYLSLRLELDPSPLMLGFILGPMLEENFRRAMLLSGGSFTGFVTRPVSGTLLALIGLFVIWQVVSVFVSSRRAALQLSSEL